METLTKTTEFHGSLTKILESRKMGKKFQSGFFWDFGKFSFPVSCSFPSFELRLGLNFSNFSNIPIFPPASGWNSKDGATKKKIPWEFHPDRNSFPKIMEFLEFQLGIKPGKNFGNFIPGILAGFGLLLWDLCSESPGRDVGKVGGVCEIRRLQEIPGTVQHLQGGNFGDGKKMGKMGMGKMETNGKKRNGSGQLGMGKMGMGNWEKWEE